VASAEANCILFIPNQMAFSAAACATWWRVGIAPIVACPRRPASTNDATPKERSPLQHAKLLVERKSPTRPFPRPRPIRCYKIGILDLAARFTEFFAAGNL
jgi:hypothetical protein